jgi:hypothetical protein
MAAGRKTGGRAKGVPNKTTADVKVAAQAYTEEAVTALANIMRMSESDAAKVAAIKELLDRGHGKAKQAIDVDASVRAAVTTIERQIVRPRDNAPDPNR